MTPSSPQELLPDADFEFSMKLRPGDPQAFFAASAEAATVLTERNRWLAEDAGRRVILDTAYAGLVGCVAEFAGEAGSAGSLDPRQRLIKLGCTWEPDFLVVSPDTTGRFVLRAGCVCFPSGWSPEEKLGLPVEEIHGVVPGLNAAVGAKIHQFLARLKPGAGWYRSNWGVSSSPERNQHPERTVNRLKRDTPPETTWLRIEHQVLTALPGCDAVLFGIRLQMVSLAQVKADRGVSDGLRRALDTMPDDLTAYKNLTAVSPALLEYLS